MFTNFAAQDAKRAAVDTTIGDMTKDLWGTTGGRIKWARMRAGMTQAALGHAVGVKNVYISQLENNVHEAGRARVRLNISSPLPYRPQQAGFLFLNEMLNS